MTKTMTGPAGGHHFSEITAGKSTRQELGVTEIRLSEVRKNLYSVAPREFLNVWFILLVITSKYIKYALNIVITKAEVTVKKNKRKWDSLFFDTKTQRNAGKPFWAEMSSAVQLSHPAPTPLAVL